MRVHHDQPRDCDETYIDMEEGTLASEDSFSSLPIETIPLHFFYLKVCMICQMSMFIAAGLVAVSVYVVTVFGK
jgi:hypothetical protein